MIAKEKLGSLSCNLMSSEIAALTLSSQGDWRSACGMRFAGSKGEAGRVELGIRSPQLCSSSVFLPSALLAFKAKVLRIGISEYSFDGGRTRHSSKSGESLGFRPRRSGNDGSERSNQLSSE
jgi:hypothetical protein